MGQKNGTMKNWTGADMVMQTILGRDDEDPDSREIRVKGAKPELPASSFLMPWLSTPSLRLCVLVIYNTQHYDVDFVPNAKERIWGPTTNCQWKFDPLFASLPLRDQRPWKCRGKHFSWSCTRSLPPIAMIWAVVSLQLRAEYNTRQ